MPAHTSGRVTLPVECGLGDTLEATVAAFGADAVRNSDGTELPPGVGELGLEVYGAYFPARGDQEFALTHPGGCPQIFLMSPRVPAFADGPLTVPLMERYLADQVTPNLTCDRAKYWQVIDRTNGQDVDPEGWRVEGEGAECRVVIDAARAGHVYTATFLAHQRWDPTQMYNYVTNNWDCDPTRDKEIPYDVRDEAVWQRVTTRFEQWLEDHPQVTTVRFTTFFYHFTLVFNAERKEGFVDWFGYTASVSPAAIEAFEEETGWRVRPEDFVREGTYSTPFVPPTPLFRAWIRFQTAFVRSRVRHLTDQAHARGRRAIMFLGDNWIGTEPYAEGFADTGLDGVVGSVGNAATCRMIAEIPGVDLHEGRLLPYFFPDVFHPGGDPVAEANVSWRAARRALLRKPLERIGYGGYLSLAAAHPDFMERAGLICDEFRALYDALAPHGARTVGVRVGVLSCWGALRSWQNHMVAHAVPYRFTDPYVGVIEALAGLPVDVSFLSFDDVRAGGLDDIDVVINCGARGDAFSGGAAWADPQLCAAVRLFVAKGGGFVGIGDPTAWTSTGTVFQLGDVLGVDAETGSTLSTDRYATVVEDHFITTDLPADVRLRRDGSQVVATSPDTRVLRGSADAVEIAISTFGEGRGVYLAGLEYSPATARVLLRALVWAGRGEDRWLQAGIADDPAVDVAVVADGDLVVAANSSDAPVTTTLHLPRSRACARLEAGQARFLRASSFDCTTG